MESTINVETLESGRILKSNDTGHLCDSLNVIDIVGQDYTQRIFAACDIGPGKKENHDRVVLCPNGIVAVLDGMAHALASQRFGEEIIKTPEFKQAAKSARKEILAHMIKQSKRIHKEEGYSYLNIFYHHFLKNTYGTTLAGMDVFSDDVVTAGDSPIYKFGVDGNINWQAAMQMKGETVIDERYYVPTKYISHNIYKGRGLTHQEMSPKTPGEIIIAASDALSDNFSEQELEVVVKECDNDPEKLFEVLANKLNKRMKEASGQEPKDHNECYEYDSKCDNQSLVILKI